MSANKATPVIVTNPSIKRRLISMVYEVLLAFAVLFLPFLVFEMISGASHTAVVEHLRQALAFLILGAYFIHQWSRKGQTLAMQTWRLKVVMPGQANVPLKVATLRYLASWMWVLPALLLDYALGLEKWHALYALFGGVLLWSLTAFFDKDRQFLHDKIAGTRMVQLPKLEKKKAKAQEAKA
ncbi:RDD family protein [Pseudoduganella violacea]|uniref:Putative RDD family membrane protein YckC n=1 Tax=Pseudoduganella violacea TaxID=1715466 RepID=A0A7W5B8Y9_9BURK|nr:RDD family protein [Pseudoduganella violacea]MBB3118719.1 putative RDD family membrane protein YckC [Pseudoduganella violacea]